MFSIENFDRRPIKKDGNCLFRAVTSHLNDTLRTCRRNKEGLPTNKDLRDEEDHASYILRLNTVMFMNYHSNVFTNSVQLEDDDYNSFKERVINMENDGVFGGNLELYVLSKMFNIQINVFVKYSENSKHYSSKYNLVSRFGNYVKQCNLLLHNNHYELLNIKTDFSEQFNTQFVEWIQENPELTFNDVLNEFNLQNPYIYNEDDSVVDSLNDFEDLNNIDFNNEYNEYIENNDGGDC